MPLIKKRLRKKTMKKAIKGQHSTVRYDPKSGRYTKLTFSSTSNVKRNWDKSGVRASVTKTTRGDALLGGSKRPFVHKEIEKKYDEKGRLIKRAKTVKKVYDS